MTCSQEIIREFDLHPGRMESTWLMAADRMDELDGFGEPLRRGIFRGSEQMLVPSYSTDSNTTFTSGLCWGGGNGLRSGAAGPWEFLQVSGSGVPDVTCQGGTANGAGAILFSNSQGWSDYGGIGSGYGDGATGNDRWDQPFIRERR